MSSTDAVDVSGSVASDSALVPTEKRCRECGEVKPGSAFRFAATNADRLNSLCRPCEAKRVGEAQRRKREEIGEEAWLAQNREKVQRSRQKRDYDTERKHNRARWRAMNQLKDRHPKEYEVLLRVARHEEGL